MTIYQGRAREVIFYLQNVDTPVTGLLFLDVTVGVRKPTEVGFTDKTVTIDDWLEIGDGYYAVNLSETDTDTVGPLLVKVSGAGFDTVVLEDDVDPIPFGSLVDNNICVLSGTIMDLGGDPKWQVPLMFRPVELPTAVNGALITGDPIRTICDVYGNFYVMLLRNSKVLVEIERTAIRHIITIPDQSNANIVDLLPPLDE